MCGICGAYEFRQSGRLRADIGNMLAAISHRGVTDGMWIHEHVGLGARRLPIIDIPNSPQPIANEDGTRYLAGNGEIYNYRSLRDRLIQKGHRFRTDGDMECILHLLEEDGDEAWDQLRGMFAVAVYDTGTGVLTLARDHMGIKPLFYRQNGSAFLFASEIKCLLTHPSFTTDLNPQAISDYLSLQFIPKPQTIYKETYSLPPGSVLTLKDGKVDIRPYWVLDGDPSEERLDDSEIAATTGRLLETAVQRRLISDVPVGVLLSGGLDSSAIAALAAEQADRQISTFAIVFKEKTFDESPYSKLMARHLSSRHHEMVFDARTILDSMEEVSYFFDEPFCEGSAFPIYHICKYAKDYVTVILSGEGADEIFGGYETYTAQNFAGRYRRLPQWMQALARAAARRLPVSDNKVSIDMKIRRFTDGVQYGPAKSHFWWRASMNDSVKLRVLSPDFSRHNLRKSSELYEQVFQSLSCTDTLNGLMMTDCMIHLVDDLLLRADRMSMAHTMELRVPFLDIDLVRHAFSIPSGAKIRGMSSKIPLRRALAGRVPDSIRRRSKKGLNMPYQKWFKKKGWRELLHDSLRKDAIESTGVLSYPGVQAVLEEHRNGKDNHAHALWAILNLVLWLDKRKR